MAFVPVNGWGLGKWKVHADTLPGPVLRLRGWAGGRQWGWHCLDNDTRVLGFGGGGQWKLFCSSVQP